jgi:hypothetical protein
MLKAAVAMSVSGTNERGLQRQRRSLHRSLFVWEAAELCVEDEREDRDFRNFPEPAHDLVPKGHLASEPVPCRRWQKGFTVKLFGQPARRAG